MKIVHELTNLSYFVSHCGSRRGMNSTRQIELLEYETWIGKSAGDVLHVIKERGGWSKAYPKGSEFPMWLSRVRNFFNECPNTVMLLDLIEAASYKIRIPWGEYGPLSAVVAVYRDESGRHWFQTPPAGTIYHSKGDPNNTKAAQNTLGGQHVTETFKLLKFDGTGGSSELILLNQAAWIAHNSGGGFFARLVQRSVAGGGKAFFTNGGRPANVRGSIVQDERFAASYNFGDFYYSSEATHKRLDVDTHSIEKNFYVKVNQRLGLGQRFFPKASAGIDIAESDKHFKYGH